MARNPRTTSEHVYRLTTELNKAAAQLPELRIGQLLVNASTLGRFDLYFVKNQDLIAWVDELVRTVVEQRAEQA